MNLYYLLHLQTNYSDPINKVRKDVIDKILIHLPKRETINEMKMAAAMKTFKSKFDLNEAECAYLVYKWISQNIEYDCFGVNNYTEWHGEALTYKEGKGVCSGFSYIFRTLCRFLGLEAEFVAGYTRSSDISIPSAPDHAWNSVKIDSTYYLIDSTWGSGICNNDTYEKIFNDFYFCPDPKIFIRSHLPIEAKWQLLPNIVTYEQFDNQAFILETFFLIGLETLSPDKKIINVNGKGSISLTYDELKEGFSIKCIIYYINEKEEVQEMECLFSEQKGIINFNFNLSNPILYKLYIIAPYDKNNYTAAFMYLNNTKEENVLQ